MMKLQKGVDGCPNKDNINNCGGFIVLQTLCWLSLLALKINKSFLIVI